LSKWITEFLSTPSLTFNKLPPCPYAKKAWLDGAVHTHYLNETFEIKMWIAAELENYTYHWPKGKEVVVLCFNPNRITPTELSQIVEKTKPLLDSRGYIALEDHPEEIEQVDGKILNQGTYGLVLIQEKSKLNTARKWLKNKGYYKNWDKEYYNDVVET